MGHAEAITDVLSEIEHYFKHALTQADIHQVAQQFLVEINILTLNPLTQDLRDLATVIRRIIVRLLHDSATDHDPARYLDLVTRACSLGVSMEALGTLIAETLDTDPINDRLEQEVERITSKNLPAHLLN